MTGLHSPWPLFGNDLDLARSWLHPQLRDLVSARIGHLAISLGLGDELLNGLQAGMLQADARALRQWRFRIARLHKETNPYRYLLRTGFSSRPWPSSRKTRSRNSTWCSAEWRHRRSHRGLELASALGQSEELWPESGDDCGTTAAD